MGCVHTHDGVNQFVVPNARVKATSNHSTPSAGQPTGFDHTPANQLRTLIPHTQSLINSTAAHTYRQSPATRKFPATFERVFPPPAQSSATDRLLPHGACLVLLLLVAAGRRRALAFTHLGRWIRDQLNIGPAVPPLDPHRSIKSIKPQTQPVRCSSGNRPVSPTTSR